jgi:hypothetical protein
LQTQSSTNSSSSSAPSNNGNTNSATNGNGTASSNDTEGHAAAVSSNIISTEQDFAVLQAADLPNMQFDAIVVLAGGLLPDGGLPVWAERRLDLGRDLHMMLGRRPPILCSGEVLCVLPVMYVQLLYKLGAVQGCPDSCS